MFLASTSTGHPASFLSGRMWRFDNRAETDPTEEHFRQLFLPFGVNALDKHPSVAQYGNRLYVVGGHTDNLVVDEHERIHRMGLMSPAFAPDITGAAGTGTIGYLSFWDELTNEFSPLSGGTEISNATPRTWINLPTHEPNNFAYLHGWVRLDDTTDPDTAYATGSYNGTTVDWSSPISWLRPGDKICDTSYQTYAYLGYPGSSLTGSMSTLYAGANIYDGLCGKPLQRASHICLWLSVAGGLPRLVTKVRLGVETVVESVSTAMLAEAHPGNFDRFPICTMNAVYHDRLVMAGNANALDTVYLSPMGYPERFEGFSFKTRNGEAVTGLLASRDYCLILTEDSTYTLQGYTEDDMVVSLLDNGIGAAAHQTNAVVNGTPYITNRAGIYAFNGSWHPVMLGVDKTFSKHYANNRDHYRTGYLLHNPVDKTVQLFLGLNKDGEPFGRDFSSHFIPGQEGGDTYLYETCNWVVNYETVQPQSGGGFSPGLVSTDRFYLPLSNSDQHLLTASAFLPAEDGISYVYHGTNKGLILREDENETFLGESIILTPHYLFDSAGGFESEGITLVKFWTHCSAEQTSWYACALGGDEWVGLQSFLTSTNLYGIDDPHLIDHRLWGTVVNKTWDDPGQPPAGSTVRNGFGVEHYAHALLPSFLTGSAVPSWDLSETPVALDWVATPKSVHEHPLPDSVSGRGVCFLYYFLNPKNVVWRGMGGVTVPGPVTRPTFFVTSYPVVGP